MICVCNDEGTTPDRGISYSHLRFIVLTVRYSLTNRLNLWLFAHTVLSHASCSAEIRLLGLEVHAQSLPFTGPLCGVQRVCMCAYAVYVSLAPHTFRPESRPLCPRRLRRFPSADLTAVNAPAASAA